MALEISLAFSWACIILLAVWVERQRRALRDVNASLSYVSDIIRLLVKRTEPARRAKTAEPF